MRCGILLPLKINNMKKRSIIFLLIVLLASCAALYAKLAPRLRTPLTTTIAEIKTEASRTEARKGDYIVKLISSPMNTYGFEIRKKDKVVYLQLNNPFSHSPEGFVYSNDAINVGLWVIDQLEKTGRFPMPTDFNEALEKELNVKRFLNQK